MLTILVQKTPNTTLQKIFKIVLPVQGAKYTKMYQQYLADFNSSEVWDLVKSEIIKDAKQILKAPDTKAYLELNVGQGGDDAQNCTFILAEAYIQFFKTYQIPYELIDISYTGKNMISSAIFHIKSLHAYELLMSEAGSHRIERVSPFSSQKKIHTSNVNIFIYPAYLQKNIEIKPEELEIKTAKATGPGGQHVNKTETAIIVKHIPTGIIVKASKYRSQHQNKQLALHVLHSKLAERSQQEARNTKINIRRSTSLQILRTYDYTYDQIKDNITKFKLSNINGVFRNGLIGAFVLARLLYNLNNSVDML